MKPHIRIILLVSLLAAFLCIGFLSSGKGLSDSKVTAPEDLPIYLDGEPLGSVTNTQPLEKRFRSFKAKVDARQGNLNYNVGLGGGRLTIGRIVVFPDDRLSAGQLGHVWDKIYEFFDDPPFERIVFWGGGACEKLPQRQSVADGSTFVLSNAPLSTDEQKKIRSNKQCWLHTEVVTIDQSLYSRQQVKSYRVSVSTIEITDTGSYLLNEQSSNPESRVSPIANLAHPTLRRKLDTAKIKQRPISSESLEKEVRSWIEKRIAEGSDDLVWDESGSVVLPIIINKKTPYSSLAQVLRLIKQPKIRITVIIEDPAPARTRSFPE